MTSEKFENEILSDEQLDAVAGGNFKEISQLLSTISVNKNLQHEFKEICSSLTYGDLDMKNMQGALTILLDGMGIEAKISSNYATENTYKDKNTGKLFSHDEVIAKIKSYP